MSESKSITAENRRDIDVSTSYVHFHFIFKLLVRRECDCVVWIRCTAIRTLPLVSITHGA